MREHLLFHLKVWLTVFLGVLWMVNIPIDEAMMGEISGASTSDLNFWGTKGAGFALIAAVGVFVALIPSGRWSDMAAKAMVALATVSAAYCLFQDSTGGQMGRYIPMIVASGCIITIGLLAGAGVSAIHERREERKRLNRPVQE